MTHISGEPILEAAEVIVPLGENEWRPTDVHGLDDVVADAAVAQFVIDQLLVESLELHSLVAIRTAVRMERRGLHEDEVLEGASGRLRFCVHSMANRSALHEDDGMVAVLARDSRRKPRDESRLGLTRHLLEAVR